MTSDTARQDALLDELLKGYIDPREILSEYGLLKQLTRRLVERALEAEMTAHVGYASYAPEGRGSGNSRNGKHAKTIQTATGQLAIEVPRDRNSTFEPQLVPKRQRRLNGFDDRYCPCMHGGYPPVTFKATWKNCMGWRCHPRWSPTSRRRCWRR